MSCYFLIGSSANLRIVQSLISHLTTLNFRYKNQSISHFTLNSRKVLRFSHVYVTSQNMLWHLSASKQLDSTPFQVCIPQLVHKFNSKIRKMKTSQNKCFRSCLNQNKMYYVYRKEAETALGTHELSLNTMTIGFVNSISQFLLTLHPYRRAVSLNCQNDNVNKIVA